MNSCAGVVDSFQYSPTLPDRTPAAKPSGVIDGSRHTRSGFGKGVGIGSSLLSVEERRLRNSLGHPEGMPE